MVIALNILFVLAGWVVVHCLSVKREKDAEKRLLGVQTIELLEDLEQAARKYHTGDRMDAAEQHILYKITRIERRLRRMRLDKTMSERMYIVKIRQSITFGNFATPDFAPQDENSRLVAEIGIAITAQIEFIEEMIIRLS